MGQTDNSITGEELKCFHCGEKCSGKDISLDDKVFCCTGCKTVYEILEKNNLCYYYAITPKSGNNKKKAVQSHRFSYLDDPEVKNKLVHHSGSSISAVSFYIPQMHCSSCIWLLENLYRLDKGVAQSRVDFLQKQLTVKFIEGRTTLRRIVELLSTIGYEPELTLDSTEKKESTRNRSLYYKIGIAGFCFANIMLLSFPEYLSIVNSVDPFLKSVFGRIIILLSLPVFFYCSSDYFKSAFGALKKKSINIDFPISLGIFVLFSRSAYEIIFSLGSGYFDSMSGLVFFLLLGRLFQNKTYDTINFDRTYRAYFPLAVTMLKKGKERSVPVTGLKDGDRILIRNNELIPADCVLIKGRALIDYSFVTGESKPVIKYDGDIIYAGGRQTGTAIELEVIRGTSRSYITQLWNSSDFSKPEVNRIARFSNLTGKYFTITILIIATAAAVLHFHSGVPAVLNVFTSVLIVACPCALALSTPFTLGSTLRIFGRNSFYLKGTSVIERLAKLNHIVFDKTGTLTKANASEITYFGDELSEDEAKALMSLVHNSTHPLSRKIFETVDFKSTYEVNNFREFQGEGLSGTAAGKKLLLGSGKFISRNINPGILHEIPVQNEIKDETTTVYLAIDGIVKGCYRITNVYRDGLDKVVDSVRSYELSVLSGDNEGERKKLDALFKGRSRMYFGQSPEDKMNYIKSLQAENKKVLMIGDGLNDAGALKKSDVGISISEDVGSFTPASDAILDAAQFARIGDFLSFSRLSIKIIYINLVVSLLYNVAGLTFAVAGKLTPVIAAILMPLSSITVVMLATLATKYMAKVRGL